MVPAAHEEQIPQRGGQDMDEDNALPQQHHSIGLVSPALLLSGKTAHQFGQAHL